jgi:hypothetical protein
MKVLLSFKPTDFATLRTFSTACEKQLGKNCYAGTDSLCIYFDYPKELKAMLRPYPPKEQLQFELSSDQ